MAKGRIKKTTVDEALPQEQDWFLWDERVRGFGLKVTPKGAKTYIFQYRMGGRASKVRRYTIGKHGKLTPDGARKIAERLAAQVAQGEDPQHEKIETRKENAVLAFAAYAEKFAADYLSLRWPKTGKQAAVLLRKYVAPIWRDKPLTAIRRKDMSDVLRPLRSQPATEKSVYAVVRKLFNWAVSEGDINSSPLVGMEAPAGPPARDRVLTDEEVALIWQCSYEMDYPYGPAARVLILTGQRLREVTALSWSELSRDEAMWRLPAPRTKNKVAHTIPLSPAVISELNLIAESQGHQGRWPRAGYVFTTTNGAKPINGFSKAKARLDKVVASALAEMEHPLEMESWRFHDFRRTLATGMQRLGVRFEVTEAILNHVSGAKGGIAGIYQRHDWADEKAAALNAWADHIAYILSGEDRGNVVPLVKAS